MTAAHDTTTQAILARVQVKLDCLEALTGETRRVLDARREDRTWQAGIDAQAVRAHT